MIFYTNNPDCLSKKGLIILFFDLIILTNGHKYRYICYCSF